MSLTIGSLFSGIGGLELGLEWAGLGPVVWQCEIDPFCRAVLAKHWPNVERFEDVTRPRDWPHVDLICGGFPCQDVSSAGKRRGIGGQRSGLWFHFARIVRDVRPRLVVVENVASGASRWLRPIRHQLHLFGYRTRALGIAASDCGAPHKRARVFIVAHTDRAELREQSRRGGGTDRADPSELGRDGAQGSAPHTDYVVGQAGHGHKSDGSWTVLPSSCNDGSTSVSDMGNASSYRRVDDGLSRRLDRARVSALGNAVVPQCAQVVGEVIRQLIDLSAEAAP